LGCYIRDIEPQFSGFASMWIVATILAVLQPNDNT
jgi:hypothetical protein